MSLIQYGNYADRVDEHLQLSETDANEALKGFCRKVGSHFQNEYLNWCPTPAEKVHKVDEEEGILRLFWII